jgi:GNAT superfamily N-acetyltransferase
VKAFCAIAGLLFAYSALLQLNDPDPARWFVLYAAASACFSASTYASAPKILFAGLACAAGAWALTLVPGVWSERAFTGSEEERELAGLLLVALASVVLLSGKRSTPDARPPPNPHFREAGASDATTLLGFMRDFNASQGYPFEQADAKRVLLELLGSPSQGRTWLIEVEGVAVGYLALTFGFSLEYGGRDAFVDEFFIDPAARGRGLGRAALSFALAEAPRLGVHAVHLEVEHGNRSAHTLYVSAGFVGNDRRLLTQRVERSLTRDHGQERGS